MPADAWTAVGACRSRRENFPVASLLVAPALRRPVLQFYFFARTADDVADSPTLSAAEKLARLDRMELALLRADPVEPAACAVAEVERLFRAGVEQARQLLSAFRQDVEKRRYADWDELLAYCRQSADPVGRFLLRLHREPASMEDAADALCTALQVLNHLQDLKRDRLELDRIYLPEPWLAAAGGEEAFFAPHAAEARRPALDAALDQVDQLLATASVLPAILNSPRLALQAEAALACARLLCQRLRARDPVVERVTLRPPEVARIAALAPIRSILCRRRSRHDAAVTRRIVARSSSSFRLGMACLAEERRRAIHAVYAFCRVVDDAADCFAPAEERRRFVERWRDELKRGTASRTPVGRELAWASARFDLPSAELHLLLDGLNADAADQVRMPDEEALDRYCRAVAGTVGLLSVRIFGAGDAEEFALRLARALQLVNVLRDADEDAARDRVYIPSSMLETFGVGQGHGEEVVRHPGFARAWDTVATQAELAFAAAEQALAGLDRRALRPALVMRASYLPLLGKLKARGWRHGGPRLRLGKLDRIRLAGEAVWKFA
jgi:hydroxysqualene synthase